MNINIKNQMKQFVLDMDRENYELHLVQKTYNFKDIFVEKKERIDINNKGVIIVAYNNGKYVRACFSTTEEFIIIEEPIMDLYAKKIKNIKEFLNDIK